MLPYSGSWGGATHLQSTNGFVDICCRSHKQAVEGRHPTTIQKNLWCLWSATTTTIMPCTTKCKPMSTSNTWKYLIWRITTCILSLRTSYSIYTQVSIYQNNISKVPNHHITTYAPNRKHELMLLWGNVIRNFISVTRWGKMSDRIPINSDQFQAHFFLSKVDNHAL